MSWRRYLDTFPLLIVIATAGVLAAYAQTTQFGFHYDDYHTIRPWSAAELREVLTGTWDPTKIEVAFYRPLAAWWYALRFELFGLNAVALRWTTVIGMIVCAVLVGIFVRRETGRSRAALVAAGLYAVHPALPYAQGVWLTNQMHLLATLAVVSGLLLWQRARARSAWAWGPVFAVQIVAFGIKEDTLMLMPLVLALSWVRFRFIGGVPPPGPSVFVVGVLLVAGLAAARHALLGGLGGYTAVPTAERGWFNYRRGLDRVLRLVPPDRPWQPLASVFSTAVLLGGAAMGFLRRAGPGAYLLVAGLLTILFFNAPFVLVTKDEQVHLLALGAAIALTGGLEVLIESTRIRFLRWAIGLVAVGGAMSLLAVTRQRANDFMPCSSRTLETDAIVTGWWVVPHEIQEWLVAKPAACRSGTPLPLSQSLTTATWAYGREHDERGRPYQWTSGRAVTFVHRHAIRLTLSLRGPTASAAHPIDIIVSGPVSVRRIKLTSGEWQMVAVPLEMTLGARLRGMHRVDLDVSPTFVPHALDPADSDVRELGVQLRILELGPAR